MVSLTSMLGPNRPVYLYDLEVFRPPAAYKVDQVSVIRMWEETQRYNQDDVDFQRRVYARSGLSPTLTHLPPNLNPAFVGNDARTDLDSAAVECRTAVCGAVSGLLKKTGIKPSEIDILVTTCSIYCPTPSMASMVVNAFKLRKDVQAYHLGGMGCANGVVAINMAHPNANALFVTTETTTPAYYRGNERHRLVTNLLFRMGAAAMLLTNKRSLAIRGPLLEPPTGSGAASSSAAAGRRRYGPGAKYVLQHRVRVHLGQSDEAISAIYYGPDAEGLNGIYLGKNVVKEASRALSVAVTKVAPWVLTWSQLLEAGLDMLQQRRAAAAARRNRRRVPAGDGDGDSVPRDGPLKEKPQPSENGSCTPAENGRPPAENGHKSGEAEGKSAPSPAAAPAAAAPGHQPYRPNFTKSTVSHFLLHAGGAKVLDGLGEALQLDATRLAPSRSVLHDYGNISSSTTWYTLACVETLNGVRRGERIMQVGVGSGIKCGVNVWKALRDVREVHDAWSHRLSPEERRSLALERSVDVAFGGAHLALRGLFAVLMLLAAIAMHALMLRTSIAA
ncbi:hypothetical protein GPECTOR_32g417 [Gonium pectorale]|uniref:3-ketoacyl-CoA synthase n=1 Tax=Gonium pectorale TaxID=33097 RepID=A0A150GDZ7_GONPE|nr:hypothetical protein GPECTOR_32g417 [Gonium pectorale]|eukprot:KXZ47805.1 hypothetical protein GPECTOR_32g417 [Gonium pectorale]